MLDFLLPLDVFFPLQGEDPSTGNPNFWDELFLLKVIVCWLLFSAWHRILSWALENTLLFLSKVNGDFVVAEFEKLNGEQLLGLKVWWWWSLPNSNLYQPEQSRHAQRKMCCCFQFTGKYQLAVLQIGADTERKPHQGRQCASGCWFYFHCCFFPFFKAQMFCARKTCSFICKVSTLEHTAFLFCSDFIALRSHLCARVFLQTISALIKGVFRKSRGDVGFEVIDILVGFDSAEAQMQVSLCCFTAEWLQNPKNRIPLAAMWIQWSRQQFESLGQSKSRASKILGCPPPFWARTPPPFGLDPAPLGRDPHDMITWWVSDCYVTVWSARPLRWVSVSLFSLQALIEAVNLFITADHHPVALKHVALRLMLTLVTVTFLWTSCLK